MADPERKARLAALRAAAAEEGDLGQQDGGGGTAAAAADEPVLRFRNYAPTAEDHIQHEKVRWGCGRPVWAAELKICRARRLPCARPVRVSVVLIAAAAPSAARRSRPPRCPSLRRSEWMWTL